MCRGETGSIGRKDGQVLLPANDRFREMEKGFRMMGNRPISTLPSGEELERLARTLGAADGKALEEELRQLMSDTRGVFDSFVAAGKAEPFQGGKGADLRVAGLGVAGFREKGRVRYRRLKVLYDFRFRKNSQ